MYCFSKATDFHEDVVQVRWRHAGPSMRAHPGRPFIIIVTALLTLPILLLDPLTLHTVSLLLLTPRHLVHPHLTPLIASLLPLTPLHLGK